MVLEIFHAVLEDTDDVVDLDRVHRDLGPRPVDPSRPQDVICRLTIENLAGPVQGHAETQGPTETRPQSWDTERPNILLGIPASSNIPQGHNRIHSSVAHHPALFRFLETDPIPVPDWLQILPVQRADRASLRFEVPYRQANREAGEDTGLPQEENTVSRPWATFP